MKTLLAKRSKRKSIGLLVGEKEISLCVMAATPLGKVELFRTVEARGSETFDVQVGRMLGPWLKGRPRPKVVLGVSEVRVFHSSRAMDASVRKDPEIWLQEALRTAGTRMEDMVIELAETTVGKQTVGSLVSCAKRVLTEPLAALSRRSARLTLAEPVPCGLLRAALSRLKAPRKSVLSARFLLGERQAIGLLVAGTVPILWRIFDLTPGAESMAIHSALVALRMQARHGKLEAEIDAVLIQGRPDLAESLDPVEFGTKVGVKVIRADEPGFDSGSIASGLAMGGLTEESKFDLARTFKPQELISEIFPWGDLVMQTAMLAGILLLISDKARSLDSTLASTEVATKKYHWLGNRQEVDLDKEKSSLIANDKTIKAFLTSRIPWSGHVRDVASLLPSNTRLRLLTAAGELGDLSGKGTPAPGRKTFVMRLESPIPSTGETPREVDFMLGSLRDKSRLRRDFPLIELKDLKTTQSTDKAAGLVASYSIVCLPVIVKPAPKPAKPAK